MTEKNTWNVIIVDEHPLTREGMTMSLESDNRIKVIHSAADGTDALRSEALKRCDIMILDLMLPLLDGFNVIRKLNVDFPSIAALVFTMHANLEFFNNCIGMGAKGYVLKRDPPETLINAVKSIMSGKLGISPSISPIQTEAPEYDENLGKLTARETEVLSLVAGGMTSRDIARALNVKKSTVDKHREHIRAKLGTDKFPELLLIARKNRLF